ncbi:MAG: hypothetical protein U0531_14075 [Dehalococcoidia bacterium]
MTPGHHAAAPHPPPAGRAHAADMADLAPTGGDSQEEVRAQAAAPTLHGHVPESAAETPADVREVFARTRELARHIAAELDPEVRVSFDEYMWHGTPTMDIVLDRDGGGHAHHYEITAGRAAITLRDHDILHHDLAGIVADLRAG